MVVNMKSLKQARKERVAMERRASVLFRALRKTERGRSGPGARLMPPKEREAMSRRVRVIEGEILKLRRAIRKIGAGR
jgi:hypothetical protein